MKPLIRNAKPGDEDGIVYSGIRGWQNTYKHILPIDYLTELDSQIPQRKIEWGLHLQKPEVRLQTFVAEVDQKVVGFATGDNNRSKQFPFDAEIFAIYILKDYQRGGLGKKLVKALADYFLSRKQNSMIIASLKENHSARRFYEDIGGELVGEKTFSVNGIDYPEVVYGWKNLELLSKKLAIRAN